MAKKKQERTNYNVSPEDFIRAWQTSNTAQEVADRLGMPKGIVLARASNYRRDGVKLKKLARRHKRALNVEKMNELIVQLNHEPPPDGVKRKKNGGLVR